MPVRWERRVAAMGIHSTTKSTTSQRRLCCSPRRLDKTAHPLKTAALLLAAGTKDQKAAGDQSQGAGTRRRIYLGHRRSCHGDGGGTNEEQYERDQFQHFPSRAQVEI